MKEISIHGPFVQVVTMNDLPACGPIKEEQLKIIPDGGIRIQGGKILEVGSFAKIKKNGDIHYDYPFTTVAIPGLIDAHTHLCFAGSRAQDYSLRLNGFSYLEIANLGGGILDTVRKTRNASREDLEDLLKIRINKLEKIGITTCEVKSGYGLNIEDELKILQAIQNVNKSANIDLISTCLAAHMRPPEFTKNEEYLHFLSEHLLPTIKDKKLSNRVDIFIEETAFSKDQAKNYLLAAKKLGFDLTIHADQFSVGGSQVAAELKAVSADHLEVSGPEEFNLLKQGNVIPVVLPGASLGLGIPFAPARKLLDHNLPLAIASDWNPGSAPQGNLLMQASLIGIYEKLTIAETLAAITIRAARALNLKDRGIIAPNLRADIAIFPTADYREIMYYQGEMHPIEVIFGCKN